MELVDLQKRTKSRISKIKIHEDVTLNEQDSHDESGDDINIRQLL